MNPYVDYLRQLFAMTLLGIIAGCGNIATVRSFSTAYTEPSNGDIAKIRIISNGMVRAVPGQSCINWRSPGAGVMVAAQKGFANMNNRDLQMPKNQLDTTFMISGDSQIINSELRISANVPITIDFMSQGYVSANYRYACHKSVTFTPQNGENYEGIFLEQGSQCLSKIRVLSVDKKMEMPDVEVTDGAKFCNATDNF